MEYILGTYSVGSVVMALINIDHEVKSGDRGIVVSHTNNEILIKFDNSIKSIGFDEVHNQLIPFIKVQSYLDFCRKSNHYLSTFLRINISKRAFSVMGLTGFKSESEIHEIVSVLNRHHWKPIWGGTKASSIDILCIMNHLRDIKLVSGRLVNYYEFLKALEFDLTIKTSERKIGSIDIDPNHLRECRKDLRYLKSKVKASD